MFQKQIITILISFFFVSSSTFAFAQTSTSTAAKFTFLDAGDKAPFKGTLFSPEATAKLLADKERTEQECKLKIKYESDKLQAKCIRDSDLLLIELAIEKKKYNIIVGAQDEEIKRLQEIALGSNDYSTLWFGGGVLVGIVTSVAIFFAAAEIAR
jgi:hypothetical protein